MSLLHNLSLQQDTENIMSHGLNAPKLITPLYSPLLTVRDLNVTFPLLQDKVHAVRDLNFTLNAGRTLALVGESGCGKSTTALALMRLLPKRALIQGNVIFDGLDLLAQPDYTLRQLRGKTISMIFQEPMTSLNPVYTVGAQISESLRLHEGLSKRAARQRTIELMDLVRIPDPHRRVDDYPHQLSGGQRQRVMIAMAVSCQPRLLIADEPTTALDVTIQAQILALLDELRRELSMSLLIITHDLGVVSQWADDVIVMYAGEQVESGKTRSILNSPRHLYTQGLLRASLHGNSEAHYTQEPLPEIKMAAQKGFTDKSIYEPNNRFDAVTATSALKGLEQSAKNVLKNANNSIQAMAERSIAVNEPAFTPLLAVNDLYCEYSQRGGTVKAVDGVSFEIESGETLGLVGESGCGKSTLSKTLMRLLKPAKGQITLDGKEVSQLSERAFRQYRPQIQMVFQDPYASLNPRHTVFEILASTLRVHGVKDRRELNGQISKILDNVGLPASSAQRYPNEFSGGQRQRIGIARALILKPSLVICDEPVSALDVSIQAQILNLLVELKHEYNLAYLFISHDLAVVRYIADRVMVMQTGKIVERGTPQEIWRQPQHPYTRKLLASAPGAMAQN